MTLMGLLAMEPRARDALAAEKVMGWHWQDGPLFHWDRGGERYLLPPDNTWQKTTSGSWDEAGCWYDMPQPSTNATHDYAVLVRVRDAWLYSRRAAFAAALDEIMQHRSGLTSGATWAYPDAMTGYTAGDYSLAALLALDVTGG